MLTFIRTEDHHCKCLQGSCRTSLQNLLEVGRSLRYEGHKPFTASSETFWSPSQNLVRPWRNPLAERSTRCAEILRHNPANPFGTLPRRLKPVITSQQRLENLFLACSAQTESCPSCSILHRNPVAQWNPSSNLFNSLFNPSKTVEQQISQKEQFCSEPCPTESFTEHVPEACQPSTTTIPEFWNHFPALHWHLVNW